MADGLSETARLFETEISGGRSAAPANGEVRRSAEPMFNNLGEVENPHEAAGGDGIAAVDENGEPIRRQSRKPDPENMNGPEEDEDNDPDPDAGDDDQDVDEDADSDEDAAEEDEDDPILKKKYAITVDGQEAEITLGEALKGYTRQETFHRRMTGLNEFSQKVEASAAELVQYHKNLSDQYEALAQDMQAVLPAEPNWDELFAKNPQAARAQQKTYEAFKTAIAEVRGKREKASKEAAEAEAKRIARLTDEEFNKFVGKVGWKTQKDATKGLDAMRKTGLAAGFTDQEIGSVIDSRMLTILHKAARYDRLMANKPRPVPGKGNTRTNEVLPGNRRMTSTGGRAQNQQPLQRQGQSSLEVAEAAFLREINPRSQRRGKGH